MSSERPGGVMSGDTPTQAAERARLALADRFGEIIADHLPPSQYADARRAGQAVAAAALAAPPAAPDVEPTVRWCADRTDFNGPHHHLLDEEGEHIHPGSPLACTACAAVPPAADTAPADDRCQARATDPITTRHPRDDGWRCGLTAGHGGRHQLYTAEGEFGLWTDGWDESRVAPAGPPVDAAVAQTDTEGRSVEECSHAFRLGTCVYCAAVDPTDIQVRERVVDNVADALDEVLTAAAVRGDR